MRDLPDLGVLSAFGVELLEALGGRLNRHWLVERGRERLVLRRWAPEVLDLAYELRVVAGLAERGWPVAPVVAGPLERAGYRWTLAPFLPGSAPVGHGDVGEQRRQGRLLALLHADLAQLGDFGQRDGWRRCEAILADPELDRLLSAHEAAQPGLIHILRWHLERARVRVADLGLQSRPGQVIHGDFAPWNLHFTAGQLSGLLDFELAHWNHRVADFALSWRGVYDAVVEGYAEVAPLEPAEWAMVTPVWWAFLIEGACQSLRAGIPDDGWLVRKLLVRSPLMGPDAAALP